MLRSLSSINIDWVILKWNEDSVRGMNAFQINNGWCAEFALFLKALYPNVVLWSKASC